jgi:peptide/nickel transport system ATP-binding protein
MNNRSSEPLLELENVTKSYTVGYVRTRAVVGARDVSFSIRQGEILTLLGESGSGKTTVANIILRLFRPTAGRVLLHGQDIFTLPSRAYYTQVQQVFQDPYASFNYFYKVDRTLRKALDLRGQSAGRARQEEIRAAVDRVGLNPEEVLGRYPHQLSGGQLQRLLIARVLLIQPELVVADEPTSMIDASSRAGILNHLMGLKETGIAALFITHDIGQASYVADTAVVMHQGVVAEQGPAEAVLHAPRSPYVRKLLADVPRLHEKWDLPVSASGVRGR